MNGIHAYDLVALQIVEMRRESKRWKLAADAGQHKLSYGMTWGVPLVGFLAMVAM